jgi:hypothetical protein
MILVKRAPPLLTKERHELAEFHAKCPETERYRQLERKDGFIARAYGDNTPPDHRGRAKHRPLMLPSFSLVDGAEGSVFQ